MSSIPSLTVLICCYSGEEFFEKTFESVATQTGVDFSVVIHDNGCSVSYQNKIAQAAARINAKVIRSDINRYGEGVRFDVLPCIETKYIATLHDDDVIAAGRLRLDLNAIVEYDFDYIFSDRYYIDRDGREFEPISEEINTAPFGLGDYPYQFIADVFYRGLRFHYSTLVMRTEVAQHLVYGDPYLPRIADCLFVTKLLLDRNLRGIALNYRGTAIRVHGTNDMLYSKFSPERREQELYLLTQSELFVFDWLIRAAELDQLSAVLAIFPGVPPSAGEDRPSLLVRAALKLAEWGRSKKMMAAHCVHEAFRLAPSRTIMSFRRWTERDANAFMMDLYAAYALEELAVARALSTEAHPAAIELAQLKSSTYWKLSAPLRQLHPLGVGHAERGKRKPPFYVLGSKLNFRQPEASPYLPEGFSQHEPWGRWTDGFRAVISFRHEAEPATATLELLPVMIFDPSMTDREISIRISGSKAFICVPRPNVPILVPISQQTFSRSQTVTIQIEISNPKQPEMAPQEDLRALGIGFESMTLTLLR